MADSVGEWMDVYRRLVNWELKLSDSGSSMSEMLLMQKRDANANFCKMGNFVANATSCAVSKKFFKNKQTQVTAKRQNFEKNIANLR